MPAMEAARRRRKLNVHKHAARSRLYGCHMCGDSPRRSGGRSKPRPSGAGVPGRVGTTPRGHPAVEGYIHNERYVWLSDVRVRVEVLNADGITVEEASGWVVGNIRPGGRGYFAVAVKRLGASYRVSVVSFDVVPQGGA